MSVAVVFLARGIGGGVPALTRFLESYRHHPAGGEHCLYVLMKGWDNEVGRDTARQLAGDVPATVIDLPDDGFDWGAYFRAANRLQEDWILCLNTHSRIECDNWLGLLMAAAAAPGVGAVGCTGSWGTFAPVWQFFNPVAAAVASRKGVLCGTLTLIGAWFMLPLRWSLRTGRFGGFPNPHLRSNAILLRRETLCAFAAAHRFPCHKQDALMLECGRQGLTRFLERRHLRVVVAGADGKSYGSDQWTDSRTFRVPGQRNLIISDNQTRGYDAANLAMRRIMEISAWGPGVRQESTSISS